MIVILHKDDKVISVFNHCLKEEIQTVNKDLVKVFFDLAERFRNTLIVWCELELRDFINESEFKTIFYHKLIMASFNTKDCYYIDKGIGYVESSPFINVNKKVTYPTWLMSSCIGGLNSDVLVSYNQRDYKNERFSYVLNSVAKRGISSGLFCYSAPNLLTHNNIASKVFKPSKFVLFKFIKEHFKRRWAFLTLFNYLVYEKRLLIIPFLKSLFTLKKLSKPKFEDLKIDVNKNDSTSKSCIDVIIPTIGRKDYLYDVLKDLASQTLLPKNVIIIEQNQDIGCKSDLDYMQNQSWPFHIKHTFINNTGACNARNIALKQIESDWVFLADDDISIPNETLELSLKDMIGYGLNAATIRCLRKEDVINKKPLTQWNTFGSGCSIISRKIAAQLKFDIAYEHGFGEDGDFGMQIRNLGEDIGYISDYGLNHLKAPIGGFRTKFYHPWQIDKVQPKPSPTIMLFNLKNQSKEQILGYKTILFIKFYKDQNIINPLKYLKVMKQRWNNSQYWAHKLINREV